MPSFCSSAVFLFECARVPAIRDKMQESRRGLPGYACRLLQGALSQHPRPHKIEPWILHDLRRTAATGMARLKFAPHVVDRVLNHTAGTIRGVARVYNRFDYLEERKAALEARARAVEAIVSGAEASNVVALAKARG